MSYEDFARDGTKSRRRETRRDIRRTLGTSSDPAPAADSALRAASYLDDLLADATDGRLRIRIEDTQSVLGLGPLAVREAEEEVARWHDARFVTSAEPAPGYVIRGRYADGSFRLFRREQDGSQSFAGQYGTYESAAEAVRGRT